MRTQLNQHEEIEEIPCALGQMDSDIERALATTRKTLDGDIARLSAFAQDADFRETLEVDESSCSASEFTNLQQKVPTRRASTPAHPGRPRKSVNWMIVDYLCFRQAKLSEVAEQLDISPDTLERAVKREKKMSFRTYSRRQQIRGLAALRVQIWKNAMQGDTKTLTLLSRQYLGFSNGGPR